MGNDSYDSEVQYVKLDRSSSEEEGDVDDATKLALLRMRLIQ